MTRHARNAVVASGIGALALVAGLGFSPLSPAAAAANDTPATAVTSYAPVGTTSAGPDRVGPNDPHAHFVLISASGFPIWSVDGYLRDKKGKTLHHWYEKHSGGNQKARWYLLYYGADETVTIRVKNVASIDQITLKDLNLNYCIKLTGGGQLTRIIRTSHDNGRYRGSHCTPD